MINNQVLTDISLAHKVIDENNKNPNRNAQNPNYFLKLYSFTNETLSGYFQNYHFPNHQILTLGSSADQVLNFIFHGATSITLMDLNPFVKYYYELKKAALFNMDRDTFLNFFGNHFFSLTDQCNNCVLNEKDYYKLSLSLPKDSKMFWDSLFNTYSPWFIKKHFFMKDELSHKHLIKNNPYLSLEDFKKIRQQIEKSNVFFLQDNVLNIANLNQTYDDIFLSNVLDYLFTFKFTKVNDNYEMHPSVTKEYLNFLKLVITKLNQDGVLYFHYMWDIYNSHYQYYSAFDKMLDNQPNCTKLTFPGSHHFNDELDSIYIYTKKLK